MLNKIIPFTDPATNFSERLTEDDALLNEYIDEYNDSGSILNLHKIDALTTKMAQSPSVKSGGFRIWVAQNNIKRELNTVLDNDPSVNSQKAFIESYTAAPKAPDRQQWIRLTTPFKVPVSLGRMSGRSSRYKNLDKFFQAVESAGKNKANPEVLITALENLHSELLTLRADSPKMQNKIDVLAGQTGAYLNQLIEANPDIKKNYLSTSEPTVVDLIAEEGPEAMKQFLSKIAESREPFSHEGAQLSFLGGANNKNWLMVDNETGERSIVRLETADDPVTDYAIVDELKQDPSLSKYLVREYSYFPTGHTNSGAYNIAVSEYIAEGDLQRYRKTLVSTEDITYHVANMCGQVSTMASILRDKGKMYPDIKAENFLIRDNGNVVTGDIKSVIHLDINKAAKVGQISTTPSAAPPEYTDKNSKPMLDAEKFMSYQIGLMMHFLIINPTSEEKNTALENFIDEGRLDFDHPVYQGEEGLKLQNLVEGALNSDPDARPTLDTFIQTCFEVCKTQKISLIQEENDKPHFKA